MQKLVAALCLLACLASANPVSPVHVVHEKRDSHPARWEKRHRVMSDSILPVRVGMVQSNLDNAHDFLMDVADPASPNYGKHWTAQRVLEHFAPSRETINAVTDWLISSGVSRERLRLSNSRGWLEFNASVAEAESL